MTFMSELPKIERPCGCWCLYSSQELFYATELPGNVSSWGKEPQSLGSWKVSKKHRLPPFLQRWDRVPGAGQPDSESWASGKASRRWEPPGETQTPGLSNNELGEFLIALGRPACHPRPPCMDHTRATCFGDLVPSAHGFRGNFR